MHGFAAMLGSPSEIHVSKLLGLPIPPSGADVLLDERARAEHATRLAELEREIAEADAISDPDRSERAISERDALLHELSAFLVEAAPPNRRAFYVSLQFATQNFSILIAGGVGLLLSSTLTAAELVSWGWRAAFLVGALIIPFTIAIRRTLGELSTPPSKVLKVGLAAVRSW